VADNSFKVETVLTIMGKKIGFTHMIFLDQVDTQDLGDEITKFDGDQLFQ
jgi:hypothetical protein